MRPLSVAVVAGAVAVLGAVALYMRSGDADSDTRRFARAGSGTRDFPQAPSRRIERGGARGDESGGQQRDDLGRSDDFGRRDSFGRRDRLASGQLTASNPQPNKHDVPAVDPRRRAEQDDDGDSDDDDGDAEDPQEMEELKQTLFSDPDPDERIDAVLMLTGDEGAESMRMLLEAMDDPDPEVRLAVVEALGDRSEELSAGSLNRAVRDPDSEVRFEAVSALGDIKTREARQMVEAATHDQDPDVADLARTILDDQNDDAGGPNGTAQQPAPTPAAAPAHGLSVSSK